MELDILIKRQQLNVTFPAWAKKKHPHVLFEPEEWHHLHISERQHQLSSQKGNAVAPTTSHFHLYQTNSNEKYD